MEEINTSSQLKETIMGQNRHLFLYGQDGAKRRAFLEELATQYPVQLDSQQPIAVYLDCLGLPELATDQNVDKNVVASFAQNYCYLLIASNLVNTAFNQVDQEELNRRGETVLNGVNRLFLNKDLPPLESMSEFNTALFDTRRIYYDAYCQYRKTGQLDDFFDRLPIPFIEPTMFVKLFKEGLHHSSYFGIIVDKQSPILLQSIQSLNNFIASRINADISIKIACQPDGWTSYVTLNGVLVENIHDYGTVELDDSHKEYIKKIKTQYWRG